MILHNLLVTRERFLAVLVLSGKEPPLLKKKPMQYYVPLLYGHSINEYMVKVNGRF